MPFGNGDVGAHFTGSLHEAERDGIEADDEERAGLVAAIGEGGVVGKRAEEAGILDDHAGGAGGIVALDDIDVEVEHVGVELLAVDGVERGMDDDSATAVDAHGHGGGLEDGGASFVERGVCEFHIREAADGGLVLVNTLEGALCGFGLVGRVGGVELLASGEGVDGGGNVVIVETAAEKTHETHTVLVGEAGHVVAHGHLGQRLGHVPVLEAEFRGNRREEVFDGSDADDLEHGLLVGVGGGNPTQCCCSLTKEA